MCQKPMYIELVERLEQEIQEHPIPFVRQMKNHMWQPYKN